VAEWQTQRIQNPPSSGLVGSTPTFGTAVHPVSFAVVKKRRALRGIEPLGLVLDRANEILPPKGVSDSSAPVAPRDWEAAVGTRIASRALPVKLERGVLHVRVATSTWAQELSMLVEPILAQLRVRGVFVETLRFRVGRVEIPERNKTREDSVRTSPPPVKLPSLLSRDVEAVRDDELRKAIRQAAEKNLGWQRMIGRTNASVSPNVRPNEPGVRGEGRHGRLEVPNEQTKEISPKPGVRGLRSGSPETDRPDQVAGPVSASPRHKRGLV
jgi:predicted nucleic acid-binding Zn ribbon protein